MRRLPGFDSITPGTGRSARGFTLVEVMIALVVLSIAVLGLVAAQIWALRSSEANRQRHTASEIASAQMASIESRLRADFTGTDVTQARTPVPDQAGFDYQVTPAPEGSRLRNVEVRVFYQDRTGEHAYVLWTTFYNGS